ncbi:MAG: hypothetical protein IJW85_05605, partial [Clostridia bacterium]|nr:hypothetical protein [Clostridia bacterium]
MKRMLCLLAALMLLCVPALAEEFDQAALEQMDDYDVMMDFLQVNTIVRPKDQPYAGTIDIEDGEAAVYLDFIQMPNENATLLRLMLCLTSYEFIGAGELTITVGDKD